VFGKVVYSYTQKKEKIDPKFRQLVFISDDYQTKDYKYLDYISKKIVNSKDVLFNEEKLGYLV
jgi:hypothetical protein